MSKKVTPFFIFIVLVGFSITSLAQVDLSGIAPSDVIETYVMELDESSRWDLEEITEIGLLWQPWRRKLLHAKLQVTSQRWKGVLWTHPVDIIVPNNVSPGVCNVNLVITGGKNAYNDVYKLSREKKKRQSYAKESTLIANRLKTPLAILRGNPYQPIYGMTKGELMEDELIVYTFLKYLETGDPSWILLLPMVKSVTQTMDAVQEFMEEAWGFKSCNFTLIAGSKQGWVIYLVPPVDKRVVAIVPIGFDILNMEEQLIRNQIVWGAPSLKTAPYTNGGFPGKFATPLGQDLLTIVDPYNSLSRIVIPILVISADKDSFFPLDSTSVYFTELRGSAALLLVTNQGHGRVGFFQFLRIINSISALYQHVTFGDPWIRPEWSFSERRGKLYLRIKPNGEVKHVSAVVVSSDRRDFREQKTKTHHIKQERGSGDYVYVLDIPKDKCVGIYGKIVYKKKGDIKGYALTTLPKIVGPEEICLSDDLIGALLVERLSPKIAGAFSE